MQNSAVAKSEFSDPTPPRYSSHPFPSYRFVPGRTPHPRRTPHGHSYGQPELNPTAFSAAQWQDSEDYLYGIDLYNHAYWWECHEVFEELWKIAGRHTEQGHFFQALIQLAAVNLKQFMGNRRAALNLLQRGLVRLEEVPASYMGIDVIRLTENVRQRMNGPECQAPVMRLSEGTTRTGTDGDCSPSPQKSVP